MLVIRLLTPRDWHVLRKTRLTALRESPGTFLSEYKSEKTFNNGKWRTEFDRGDWYVGVTETDPDDKPVGMLGITREPATPDYECFLEYLWVAPEHRCRGIASEMINQVLGHLKRSGIRTVFLWVLDGNDGAMRLYKRLGFVSCNVRQPLAGRPGRSEELMRLNLGWPRPRHCASPPVGT
jgi:ribosomal protein S18 acetylase RimI-like enzyme